MRGGRGLGNNTMDYKILVLDIDGTITNSKKEITKATHDAIIRVQEAGVKVVIASGRPTFGVAPVADALELAKYGGMILSFNGGMITDWRTRDIIFEKPLPNDRIDDVIAIAAQYQVALLTYRNGTVLTESPNDPYVQLEGRTNKMPVESVFDLTQTIDFPVVKFMMVGDGNYLAEIEPSVRRALGGKFSVYRSEPYFLEIVAAGIDKAKSLAILLEKLGMTKEQMVCCGDGFNDLSMIRYAGLGVAMKNGSGEVKDAADYVAPSNDEDGVAAVIDKFFLKGTGRE